jgi:hypothetical protein
MEVLRQQKIQQEAEETPSILAQQQHHKYFSYNQTVPNRK